MVESIIQCPRCGSEDVEGEHPQWDSYFCRSCGYGGLYLEFALWPVQYSGDYNYLICN